MEVYEQINLIIKEKGITKKEFAKTLISLEPKSKRTGEVMSEKAVYSYLCGKSVINSDLIPYIAEALNISEQSLFIESLKSRERQLKYILDTANQHEKKIIEDFYKDILHADGYGHILSLLKYAPEPILKKIERSLLEMKSISEKM